MAEKEVDVAALAAAPPTIATKAQDAAWEAAQAGAADWEARRRAQAEEYGTWVATGPITIGGALAFAEGHAVPNAHIEKYGLDRRVNENGQALIVKRDTKAGKDLLETIAARQRGD